MIISEFFQVSQLFSGISRVFQKLLKWFNGTTIFTSFLPAVLAGPVIFALNLNRSVILSASHSILFLSKADSSL